MRTGEVSIQYLQHYFDAAFDREAVWAKMPCDNTDDFLQHMDCRTDALAQATRLGERMTARELRQRPVDTEREAFDNQRAEQLEAMRAAIARAREEADLDILMEANAKRLETLIAAGDDAIPAPRFTTRQGIDPSLLKTERQPSDWERRVEAGMHRCKRCKTYFDRGQLSKGLCRFCIEENSAS